MSSLACFRVIASRRVQYPPLSCVSADRIRIEFLLRTSWLESADENSSTEAQIENMLPPMRYMNSAYDFGCAHLNGFLREGRKWNFVA